MDSSSSTETESRPGTWTVPPQRPGVRRCSCERGSTRTRTRERVCGRWNECFGSETAGWTAGKIDSCCRPEGSGNATERPSWCADFRARTEFPRATSVHAVLPKSWDSASGRKNSLSGSNPDGNYENPESAAVLARRTNGVLNAKADSRGPKRRSRTGWSHVPGGPEPAPCTSGGRRSPSRCARRTGRGVTVLRIRNRQNGQPQTDHAGEQPFHAILPKHDDNAPFHKKLSRSDYTSNRHTFCRESVHSFLDTSQTPLERGFPCTKRILRNRTDPASPLFLSRLEARSVSGRGHRLKRLPGLLAVCIQDARMA